MDQSEQTKTVRESSLGWKIQRIAGRLDKEMNRLLAPLDLNIQQFAVMMTVLERDGLTQAKVGKHFGMPAYAISRALDHLEKAGYLKREKHPTSRRSHTIHATAQGTKLGAKLHQIVRVVNQELAAPLSDKQRVVFNELLSNLI